MPLMSSLRTRPLLAPHPVFRSTDRNGLAGELRSAYGARVVGFGDSDRPPGGIANRVQLNGVILHYCQYDAPVEIDFLDMDGFRQFICLSGTGSIRVGGRSISIDGGRSTIVPPHSNFTASYGEQYAQLIIQLEERLLHSQMELLLGKDIPDRIFVPALESLSVDKLQRLKALAISLALQYSDSGDVNDVIIYQISQAMVSTFVFETQHNFSHLLSAYPAFAGRNITRRLEDYIAANLDKTLTVEDIANACGVSVRSVFSTFKQDRGISPMQYIRELRLEKVYRTLVQGDGNLSVLDVAMRYGFLSLGHFARRYKEKFGELPSATAARGRVRL